MKSIGGTSRKIDVFIKNARGTLLRDLIIKGKRGGARSRHDIQLSVMHFSL